MIGLTVGSCPARAERWVDIDTSAQTLAVYDQARHAVALFTDISFGSGGVADVHLQGDHTTPRGRFHIMKIRPSARFDTFILLDYPQTEQADQALRNGAISLTTRDRIAAAVASGWQPPQDTALGGDIGIHGLGRDSLSIHRRFNWTDGCVALTNKQIRQLAGFVHPGMLVVIH